MFKSFMKTNNILSIFYMSLIKLPTPINISMWWNFGSLLGLILTLQIITGFMLSMHYCPNIYFAFYSIFHIMKNINMGWLMRFLHMNGASFFFLCMYLHIGRNLYYKSFNLIKPWMIGVMIYLMSMMTAFMGYILPWGQMSYWGATVITNLLTSIPYIGKTLAIWIWGNFSIDNSTLNRFFSLHFILPIIIMLMMIMHLMFIHEQGSSNPLGLTSNFYKIPFNNYFIIKDLFFFSLYLSMFMIMNLMNPLLLNDPENFLMANPMSTPPHIQPEWYFLFAYTILRSIPNKLGGVTALIMSILILFILPLLNKNIKFQSMKFYPMNKIMFWSFTNIMIMLTWLGTQPVEPPFILMGQYLTILYFSWYLIMPMSMKKWDTHLN